MKLGLALIFPAALAAQQGSAYVPRSAITPAERVQWVIESTVSPAGLLGNAIGAGIGTGLDAPKALGPHWTGFEKRYINSMATGLLQNSMEAGLGSLWHEDPRYFPAEPGTSFKGRLGHAAKWTFYASNAAGGTHLAYARFVAIPSANALSNTWRPDSETDMLHLTERTGLGFLGHFGKNVWTEFWPDVKHKVFRTKSNPFAGL